MSESVGIQSDEDDAQARSPVTIHLLGTPHIEGLGGRSALGDLDALLLWQLAVGAHQSSGQLAQLLWPQHSPAAAGNSLRQRVFRLRRRGVELVGHGGGFHLHPGTSVDLLALQPWLDWAPTRWAESELLLGVHAPGTELTTLLDDGRRQWASQRCERTLALARDLTTQGRFHDALAWLQPLHQVEPGREAVCRALMQVWLHLGDRAAAMAAFEATERHCLQHGRAPLETLTLQTFKDLLDGPTNPDPGPAKAGSPPETQPAESMTPTGDTAAAAAPKRRLPAALLRPPRLIEREAPAAAVRQAWQDGRMAVLLGEAGMGKSRLMQDLGAWAQGQGRLVWRKACRDEAAQPYGVLAWLLGQALDNLAPEAVPSRDAPSAADLLAEADVQALGPLLPERFARHGIAWSALTGPGADPLLRRSAHRVLERALGGRSRRVVVVLDDLQRADAASLEWLRNARAGRDSDSIACIDWLLAARPAEGSAQLAILPEGDWVAIELQPLSATGLAALLDDLRWPSPTDAAHLRSMVGGNPFQVLDTLRHVWPSHAAAVDLRLGLATELAQRVGLRLSAISTEARQLAELAAVAGRFWEPGLAAAVLQRPVLALTDAWQELEDEQIFVLLQDGEPSGHALPLPEGATHRPGHREAVAPTPGIAHDLLREVLLASLPTARSVALHGLLARHLEDRPGVPAAELGRLWQAALHWKEAALAWSRASEGAAQLGRPVEQLADARSALAAWERVDDASAGFDLWYHSSDAMTIVEGIDGLQALALQLQAWADTPSRRARAAAMLAFCRLNQARLDEALAIVEQCLEGPLDAAQAIDAESRIDLLRLRAQCQMMQGRTDLARHTLEDMAALVATHATPVQALQHLGALSSLYNLERQVSRSIETLERARQLARQLRNPAEEVVHQQNLAVSLGQAGRLREALAAADEACRMHAQLGTLMGLHGPISRLNRAQIELQFGRFEPALPALETALAAIPAVVSVWHVAAAHRLALAWIWLGQHGRAHALLQEELPAALPPASRSLRHQLRARLARDQDGRLGAPGPQERRHLAAARAVWDGIDPNLIPPEHRLRMARGLAAEQALAVAAQVAQQAAAQGAFGIEAAASVLCVQALADSGQGRAAADLAWAVLQRLSDGLCVEWLPSEMIWICVRSLTDAGEIAQAADALEQARAWLSNAEEHTPPAWRTSLRGANPWHRAILLRDGQGRATVVAPTSSPLGVAGTTPGLD
jgi:tetratricopeptide (TPR) repeat protein